MMTTYDNYEILIVESDSKTDNKLIYRYFKLLSANSFIKFVRWAKEDDICRIYNYAYKKAKSDYLIFVTDDMEVGSYEWIEEMLAYASDERCALVSPKMFKGKNDIYYCGMEYDFKKKNIFKNNTENNLDFARNISVVSEHAFMIKKEDLDKLGGFNEEFSEGCFTEELSLRALKEGYSNIYTPYAIFNYYGSKPKSNMEMQKKLKETWQDVMPVDTSKG